MLIASKLFKLYNLQIWRIYLGKNDGDDDDDDNDVCINSLKLTQ